MIKKIINKALSVAALSTFTFFLGPLLATFLIYIFINCNTEPEVKQNQIEKFITAKLATSTNQIDMSLFLPEEWSKLCFLGPYTTNASTEKILGFNWDSDSLTDISTNDGKTILVFVKDNNVSYFDAISRVQIDFSSLSRQCVNREHAIFSKISSNLNGKKWVIKNNPNDLQRSN